MGEIDIEHHENGDPVQVIVYFFKQGQQSHSQTHAFTGGDVDEDGINWWVEADNVTVPGGDYVGGWWEIKLFISGDYTASAEGNIEEEEM